MTSSSTPRPPEVAGPRGVAVVSGGSAGVGRATVRSLAASGYDVAVLARGRAGLKGAVADVESCGRTGVAISLDVADREKVDAAVDRIELELGPIDIWVNCAFVGSLAYAWDSPAEEFARITEVTYYGQVHGMLAALRVMRPRDRGSIVNVSSSLAERGIPLQAAYCGAKHAIKGYTESVITELRHERSRVTVSMVVLPGVNTPQFDWNRNGVNDRHPMPVPPIYQPEVAAAAIVDVARRPRRTAWVGTPTVATVLGNRLAPGFVDWYLARTGVDAQTTDENVAHRQDNLFVARDEDVDHGARGSFTEQSRSVDPVSWLGRTLGRAVGTGFGLGLAAVDVVLGAR